MLYRGLFVHCTKIAGETALYTKISDDKGREALYPDVLIKHDFREGALVDGAAFELAEEAFVAYPPHRIFFFGIAGDAPGPEVYAWLDEVTEFLREEIKAPLKFTEREEKAVENLAETYRFTVSMGRILRELMTYAKCAGRDILLLLSPYGRGGGSKQRGKEILDELRKKMAE